MRVKLLSVVALIVLSFASITSHAAVRITEVMNDYQATNNCTVTSVAGGYNFVVYGVSCPSESGTVYVQKTYGMFGSCSMSAQTSGYFTAAFAAITAYIGTDFLI